MIWLGNENRVYIKLLIPGLGDLELLYIRTGNNKTNRATTRDDLEARKRLASIEGNIKD